MVFVVLCLTGQLIIIEDKSYLSIKPYTPIPKPSATSVGLFNYICTHHVDHTFTSQWFHQQRGNTINKSRMQRSEMASQQITDISSQHC